MNQRIGAFAKRFEDITGSAIREIFKVAAQPNMISFAGGNPASEALPDAQCAELAREVLLSDGKRILQYGATEGYPPFAESLAEYLREHLSLEVGQGSLLPVTGGTQGMRLLCDALLDPGDTVLVECPTFLGNMQVLRLGQVKLVPVESDGDGLIPEALEEAARAHHPKMLYIIPTFQNPSGATLSLERRKAVAQLAEKYGLWVAEDDPYRDLRYTGEPLPTIKSFDRAGHVVYMGSFSKTISPGLRVGYLLGDAQLMRKCAIGKQSSDLHTPTLNQALVDQYLRRGLLGPHIQEILPGYARKMNQMLGELERFPQGVRFTRPQGGLFLFVELPEGISVTQAFQEAIRRGVAYVPGTHFYPEGGHHNTLRLNFSNSTPEQITRGMGILRELFGEILHR
ncbi:MAG: PLP-dependent aminotransferase family protein [Clostridiales bacterium]|nr:PLP-dependent aminotransferase family protein [Clostridiales bacterium]